MAASEGPSSASLDVPPEIVLLLRAHSQKPRPRPIQRLVAFVLSRVLGMTRIEASHCASQQESAKEEEEEADLAVLIERWWLATSSAKFAAATGTLLHFDEACLRDGGVSSELPLHHAESLHQHLHVAFLLLFTAPRELAATKGREGGAEKELHSAVNFLSALMVTSARIVGGIADAVEHLSAQNEDDVKHRGRLRTLRRLLVEQGSSVLAAVLRLLQALEADAPVGSRFCTASPLQQRGWVAARHLIRRLAPYLYRCHDGVLRPDGGGIAADADDLRPTCWTSPLLLPFIRDQLEAVAAAAEVTTMEGGSSSDVRSGVPLLPLALFLLDATLRDTQALAAMAADPGATAIDGAALPDSGVELAPLVRTILRNQGHGAGRLLSSIEMQVAGAFLSRRAWHSNQLS